MGFLVLRIVVRLLTRYTSFASRKSWHHSSNDVLVDGDWIKPFGSPPRTLPPFKNFYTDPILPSYPRFLPNDDPLAP